MGDHGIVPQHLGRLMLDDDEPALDEEFIASCAPENGRDVSIEEVRQALSAIPGSLSDDIRAERDRQ